MSEEQERVVIRDNRKIDRAAPAAADPAEVSDAGSATSQDAASEAVPSAEAALLDERTRDLQRVTAEYANYRKRAERDRLAAGDLAVGRVLGELLPVVDDLERARAHGDLTGPLKAVADKLEATFVKLGLVSFGAVGDPFDPAMHEAVLHDESDTVSVPTCTTLMRPGYRHGERLLRPAMVGVTDPTVFIPFVEPDAAPPSTATDDARDVRAGDAGDVRAGDADDAGAGGGQDVPAAAEAPTTDSTERSADESAGEAAEQSAGR